MNTYSLIAVIATLAYIPLFLILLANRPWQRQKQTFAIFLFAIMLWNVGGFIFRSDYLQGDKIYIAKGILCLVLIVVTSLHYFLRTYYEKSEPRFPLAYIISGLLFIPVLAFMPESINVGEVAAPVYGPWVFLLVAYGLVIVGWDIYHLWGKYKNTSDPVVHNQLIYLLVGAIVLSVFAISSVTKVGQQYPLVNLGSFLNALILTYTVQRHHLMDMRSVLRRSITGLSMIAAGLVVFFAIYLVGHFLFDLELGNLNVLLGIGVALLVAFTLFQTRQFIANQVDRLFYLDRYT